MKRLLILASLATPIAANAQSVTVEDRLTASEATSSDLLNLTINLRAQLAADQKERAELLKRVTEAEKKVPQPAPTAPQK